jgi:hypothetical protein
MRNGMQLGLSGDQRKIDAGAMECSRTERIELSESGFPASDSLRMSVWSAARSCLGPQSGARAADVKAAAQTFPVCAGSLL